MALVYSKAILSSQVLKRWSFFVFGVVVGWCVGLWSYDALEEAGGELGGFAGVLHLVLPLRDHLGFKLFMDDLLFAALFELLA